MPYKTVHDLFEAWEERCLKHSKSLLFDNDALWTEKNLNIALENMFANPEEGKDDFGKKLAFQFRDFEPTHEIWLLLCDLLALHYCVNSRRGKDSTLWIDYSIGLHKNRQDYATLEEQALAIKDILGVANTGQFYNGAQWFSIGYYSSFALKYKKDEHLKNLISNMRNEEPCWIESESMFDSKKIIDSKFISLKTNRPINERPFPHPKIIQSMFGPQYHYPVFSGKDRQDIIFAFSKYLDGDENTENEKLYQINEKMKKDTFLPSSPRYPNLDHFINFYESPLKYLWKNPDNGDQEVDEHIALLKQCQQIILQGPPGTGKTYQAKKIAKQLTDEGEQGNDWELIQFHPSYNYEDFVRGIKITTENDNIVYETVNRILVQMAERASADENNNYVLIIDEINRANVSAVLGELIYALEYRGEPVSTTYSINGNAKITLPTNLYIIGTMNTADRTIGQIDYAVRRRFAFVTLLPDAEVVRKESKANNAVKLFNTVQEMFEGETYLSPDYHKNDVAIGHTYFLADNNELKNKIQYQVIPILEEYLKDGVLKKEAEEIIKQIEEEFNPQDDPIEEVETEDENLKRERKYFRWEHKANGTTDKDYWEKDLGPTRLPWTIIRDFVKHNNPANIDELKQIFPDKIRDGHGVTKILEKNRNFLSKKDESIELANGEQIMVCNQWAANQVKNHPKASAYIGFQQFLEISRDLGYKIEEI